VLMASHDLSSIDALNNHIVALLDGRVVLDWDEDGMARAVVDGAGSGDGDDNQTLESLVVETMKGID